MGKETVNNRGLKPAACSDCFRREPRVLGFTPPLPEGSGSRDPAVVVEIVPAILSKERADFEGKLLACAPFVKTIQIDIMDGKFVPNATLAPEDFPAMPKGILMEYHLMVEDPLGYVRRIGEKGAIYELHLESLKDVDGAISEVKRMGGRVALAVSPGTPAEKLAPYLKKIEHALVMTVHPGFSGQKYLPEMEGKMRWLSSGAIPGPLSVI